MALTHFAFVVFIVAGGVLALRWRRLIWIHLPGVIWGAMIEFTGWICPLTPAENWLRNRAGHSGYPGGFVEHYLMPILYPAGLDRSHQIMLGVAVIVVNALVYGAIALRGRKEHPHLPS